MRPVAVPVGPRGTFSKADWQKIKQILASIGVDLDTASVSAHFGGKTARGRVYRYSSSGHPWIATGPQWRLSEVVQRLAHFYALSEPKTPKQWAKKLTRALTLTEKALKELDFVRLAPVNNPVTAKHRALYDHMIRPAAELREHVAELQVIDSKSQSALTTLNKYCRELTDLWRALCPDKRLRRKRKLLGQFLLACSRPVFPNARKPVLAQKIKNFLTRL
jgi:hypothetical protein